ncbi:MAG: peptide chain release factor N(5)-glutamine methyltransferase [bacterium]
MKNSNKQQWTLLEVLNHAVSFLKSKNIENPRLNAEHLLAHTLGKSRMDLYLDFNEPLSKPEREKYKKFLHRRAEHEPLQYIMEETEFMSLPFYVNPDVLIPRPETEVLVESVIEWSNKTEETGILDVGCGSGAIAVSLAKYIENVRITAVDIRENILNIARQNAENNGVSKKIQFVCSDIKKEDFIEQTGKSFDIVVANPPYISKDEWETLAEEVQYHEPRHSLCDEADGLVFYQLISKKALSLLPSGGALFFEVGYKQSSEVQEILQQQGYKDIHSIKDLNQIERVVTGVK